MFSWYVCLCALVSSPHVAVVYPVSALALRLVITMTSAFLFLHEALFETSDQLLVAADLPSFPTAHCRVAEDSRIQDADDVGCACTCVLGREPRMICWRVSLYILQASTCPARAASYESHCLVLTDSGDALTCCIAQFAHSWQSSCHDTRQLQVSESVCSAELEAVFGIYYQTTAVLGMHCNPHAQ